MGEKCRLEADEYNLIHVNAEMGNLGSGMLETAAMIMRTKDDEGIYKQCEEKYEGTAVYDEADVLSQPKESGEILEAMQPFEACRSPSPLDEEAFEGLSRSEEGDENDEVNFQEDLVISECSVDDIRQEFKSSQMHAQGEPAQEESVKVEEGGVNQDVSSSLHMEKRRLEAGEHNLICVTDEMGNIGISMHETMAMIQRTEDDQGECKQSEEDNVGAVLYDEVEVLSQPKESGEILKAKNFNHKNSGRFCASGSRRKCFAVVGKQALIS